MLHTLWTGLRERAPLDGALGVLSIAFGITTAWLVGTEASDSPIQPGVAYVFFNQSTFQRPADSGIQSAIRMETKGVDFGWLWLGKLRFPQAAEVTFSAEADSPQQSVNGYECW